MEVLPFRIWGMLERAAVSGAAVAHSAAASRAVVCAAVQALACIQQA